MNSMMRNRSWPWTIKWSTLSVPGERIIRLMTTRVPVWYRLAGPGSASSSPRWAMAPSSFSSVARAASAAASDIGRPTVKGVTPDGKTTMCRKGNMGNSNVLFSVIYVSLGSGNRDLKACSIVVLAVNVQNEPAVHAFASNIGLFEIAWDRQNPLEAAIGYFELM